MTAMSSPASPPGVQTIDDWRVWVRECTATRDYTALLRLSRRAEELASAPDIERHLLPVRLAIVTSATADFFVPILKASLLRIGLRAVAHVAPYGQVTTSLLDADGPLTRFAPQVALVSHATPHLPGWPALSASLEVEVSLWTA